VKVTWKGLGVRTGERAPRPLKYALSVANAQPSVIHFSGSFQQIPRAASIAPVGCNEVSDARTDLRAAPVAVE
jgi:hypothetical protein